MKDYIELCEILIDGMMKQYNKLANLRVHTHCSVFAKQDAKALATAAKTMHKLARDILALNESQKRVEMAKKKESEKT